ncbi:MAG TPA: nitrate ABC transporter permease [Thermoanaerobaculia bacterium]|jgi:NitT/TauT family transport system permease protein|nr:nitrate ABC transporter permease [Thermoanaerobaculia bacterium]
MNAFVQAFLPNRAISPNALRIIVAFQVALLLLIWINSPFKVLPQPMEVLRAFQDLWMTQGLSRELWTSFALNLEALALSTLLSLGLSYLTVLPFFRPVALAVSKGRFLGLIGLTFVFTLMVGGGRPLKLALLVFGMTVFFITSMAAVVLEIPRERFDHARTLRMGEWHVVWEVVILGTADRAIEVLRQNAAIGWMMLTMVEGISRSEGGIGAMLLNQNKHFHIAQVFAIQITILLVGLFQDYLIGGFQRLLCPYAGLVLEKR